MKFSCKTADLVKCHILAYFLNSDNEEYLSEKYNIIFTESDIAEICKSSIVGKPHIVNFFAQKYGLDKDKLYKDLRKCYVCDARQDAATVIKAVKNSDGIAV